MNTVAMWFLNELELYKTVKPYRLNFQPEDADFPQTNVDRIQVPDVPVRNIREWGDQLEFSKCGFSILRMPLPPKDFDYDDRGQVIEQYYPFIERIVQEFTQQVHRGARVLALDHKASRNQLGLLKMCANS